MTNKTKNRSFNYYFLNKHINLEKTRGYRQTVMNLLINENGGENHGKFLFIQEKGGMPFMQKKYTMCQPYNWQKQMIF